MNGRAILAASLGVVTVAGGISPRPVSAIQDLAIAGRAGTLGLGAEVVLIANDWVSLRGGASLVGFDADITSVSGLEDNRTGTLGVPPFPRPGFEPGSHG